MSGETNEIIDLTDSFTLVDHCLLADAIIDLDDSVYYFPPISPVQVERKRKDDDDKTESKSRKSQKSSASFQSTTTNEISRGIGDCPICWDVLGKNPIASTKCGHVFCMKCIEKVVKQTKTCPTCRCILKGNLAYHPIYLSLS